MLYYAIIIRNDYPDWVSFKETIVIRCRIL